MKDGRGENGRGVEGAAAHLLLAVCRDFVTLVVWWLCFNDICSFSSIFHESNVYYLDEASGVLCLLLVN